MLHISFVHSFGNQQDPTPFAVSYEKGFDDPETEAMATSQVTFRYRSGSKSFSKVIGKSTEVRPWGVGGVYLCVCVSVLCGGQRRECQVGRVQDVLP